MNCLFFFFMTKGLANLRRLSLRDNQLQSIPSQLAPWSQLDMVDLSGNPFNCECDILWLRSALLSDVVCASPLAVSNRTLHTLSDDQLGCPTALNSNSVLIAVSATGGVLLFILTFLLWRFRRRIRHWCSKPAHPKSSSSIEDESTLNKWRPPPSPPSWGTSHNNVSLIGNRTPDYHKACTNEEECFMRAVTLHNTLKPFPRTEL